MDSEELFSLADKTFEDTDGSPSALLYFDQAFSVSPPIKGLSPDEVSTYLSRLSLYVQLLRDILDSNDCCSNLISRKLLGFVKHAGTTNYSVPDHTALYMAAMSARHYTASADSGIELSHSNLGQLIRKVVGEKMKMRITHVVRQCSELPIFADDANANVCYPSPTLYAGRIRILLQQMVVYDYMGSLPQPLLTTQVQEQQKRSGDFLFPVRMFSSLNYRQILDTGTLPFIEPHPP